MLFNSLLNFLYKTVYGRKKQNKGDGDKVQNQDKDCIHCRRIMYNIQALVPTTFS